MGHQWDPKIYKYMYIVRSTSVKLLDSDDEKDEEEEEDMKAMEEDTKCLKATMLICWLYWKEFKFNNKRMHLFKMKD